MASGSIRTAVLIAAVFFILAGVSSSVVSASDGAFRVPLHVSWAAKMRAGDVKIKKIFEFSSPVVSDSRLFIGARKGSMCAVEAANGKSIWCHKTVGAVSTTPLLSNERVYFADEKGVLYSLQANDGKENWRSQLADEVMSTPLLVGDTLYVVTVGRRLVAVDPSTGLVKWQAVKRGSMLKFAVRGTSSPVYALGKIYVGYADGSIVAHNPADGSFAWSQQLSTQKSFVQDVDTTPLISGDRLFIATTDGNTYCLDAKDGRIIWKNDFGSPNDLFLDGDKLLVSGGGVLRAIQPASGQTIWERKFDEPEVSAPVAKDGLVVVCSTREKLYVVNEENGELAFSRYMSNGTYGKPVFSGDSLFVLTNGGSLFSLKGK